MSRSNDSERLKAYSLSRSEVLGQKLQRRGRSNGSNKRPHRPGKLSLCVPFISEIEVLTASFEKILVRRRRRRYLQGTSWQVLLQSVLDCVLIACVRFVN